VRAVIIATGYRPTLTPLIIHRPSPLFCLIDKPIIVHTIEWLIRQGISKIDIILHHLPEQIEETLGDGKRWGATLTYHLAKNAQYPFASLIPLLRQGTFGDVILGQGDLFPILPNKTFKDKPKRSLFIFHNRSEWSEWCIIPAATFAKISSTMTLEGLCKELRPKARILQTPLCFSTRTFDDLYLSNRRMLSQQVSHYLFPTTAKAKNSGIWLSRAITLHPSAKIIPPVFIGEHCQINQNVTIGPNVVIEKNCLIDNRSVVENSVICQGSYVGESLEIRQSVVDRKQLINLALNTHVTITDDHILSNLQQPTLSNVMGKLFERCLALSCLIVLLPLFLMRRLKKEKVLALPAPADRSLWKTFDWLSFKINNTKNKPRLIHKIPALLSIVKGDAHFVGLAPRTIETMYQYPVDWQHLLQRGKVGMFTLAELEVFDTPEHEFFTEAYYIANKSFLLDLKILLKHLFTGRRK